MRKLARILAVAAIASMSASYAFAGGGAGTGVNGSFHDISYLGNAGLGFTSDQLQRVCVFCHTPHNAQDTSGTGVVAPLWNHAITTQNMGTQPYTWSAPANLPIAFNTTDYLIGPSRLCESCHDGSLAADAHGGVHPGTGTTHLSGANAITDLSVTHPIGFLYNEAQTARNSTAAGGIQEIADPSSFYLKSVPTASGGASAMNTQPAQRAASGFTYGTKKISDTLYSGYMTCASCHDVHNTNNVVGTVGGYNYFLWAPEEGSAICLSCHVK
jgi:hypothetical protein